MITEKASPVAPDVAAPGSPARAALGAVERALGDVWNHLFDVAAISVAWLLLVLLVVPGPPATLALFDAATRIHTRETVTLGDYLRLVGRWFGPGWRWGAAMLAAGLIVAVDLRAAPEVFGAAALPFTLALALLAGVWLLIQFYALALLQRQESPSLRLAWRNAGVMLLTNPLYSLVLAAVVAALLAASLAVLVVNLLAGPMFVAFAAASAVDDRLRAAVDRAGDSPL
jgi:hypothetical protein